MSDQTTQTTDTGPDPPMTDSAIGSPTRIHRVSPWPPFVALGFAVGEIGIVMNLVSLAIGGIVLFGGSVAGILSETKYVEKPWQTLLILGGLFVAFGVAIYGSQVSQLTLDAFLSNDPINAIAMRGEAVIAAGLLLILGAILSRLAQSQRREA